MLIKLLRVCLAQEGDRVIAKAGFKNGSAFLAYTSERIGDTFLEIREDPPWQKFGLEGLEFNPMRAISKEKKKFHGARIILDL